MRRLSKRTQHETERDRFLRPGARERLTGDTDASGRKRLEETVVFNRSVVDPDKEDAKGEAEIADAIDDERLLRSRNSTGLREVVADEEVAREANALPAKVEQQQVSTHDERTHREQKDAHRPEEARIPLARICLHVLRRVDRDQ